MGTEYGRKLIEDAAIEIKKLYIVNDLPEIFIYNH